MCGQTAEYWEALLVCCQDELEAKEGGGKDSASGGVDHGVHQSVRKDLDMMLQGKSRGAATTTLPERYQDPFLTAKCLGRCWLMSQSTSVHFSRKLFGS